ncbi:flagellar protein FlaG [Clostridium rectalis]|uniref:flagellar protein FlaG n=1 Tax=Clostridium rectalis TaxID=2040295 RepID=UPI000F62D11D|nr:flagellar protein FlaG [Clostridium rectalis]
MDVNGLGQGGPKAFKTNDISVKNFSGNKIALDGKVKNEHNVLTHKDDTLEKDIKGAVDKLNKLLEDKDTSIQYEVYGKFRDITIKIVNNKTKEVIKEIPPKKIIDMVDKLCELAGMFMDEKA